jgi:hypothetical protein
MPVTPLETLLALKVLSFVPGLSVNARAVGALLLDRYNRRTGQCDPGIDGMAEQLQICSRTVMRSIRQLERAGLIRKLRHGGLSNRNQYEVNWARFQELELAWRARIRRRPHLAGSKVSPSHRQHCHLEGDSAVTQTCESNLLKETCSKSLPRKEIGGKRSSPPAPRIAKGDIRSADVVRTEAERRWTAAVHTRFACLPVTYAEIIDAIDPVMQEAATDAEICRRGGGLAHILRELRIPDVQALPNRVAISTETPSVGSTAGAVSAATSEHDIAEGNAK